MSSTWRLMSLLLAHAEPAARALRACQHRRQLVAAVQRLVQLTPLLQLEHPANALEARTREVGRCQPALSVGLVQLLDASAHRPARLELRKHPRDLAAVHTVVAHIWPGLGAERDPAARHRRL